VVPNGASISVLALAAIESLVLAANLTDATVNSAFVEVIAKPYVLAI